MQPGGNTHKLSEQAEIMLRKLIELTELIELDQGRETDVIYLDLTKK